MDSPRWRTRLEGNEDDLSLLAEIFRHGECCVLRGESGYTMAGGFLGECEDAWNVNELSERQLELMVGAALAEAGGASLDVRCCGLVEEILPNGALRIHSLMAPADLFIGSSIRMWTERPGLASHCVGMIRENEHFDMAFRLWSDKSRTWPILYRIMEDVASGLRLAGKMSGGNELFDGELLHANGVIHSVADFHRFRYSACEARVAGRDARHAEGRNSPPREVKKLPNPEMSHSEAVSFVGETLLQLLKRLACSELKEL